MLLLIKCSESFCHAAVVARISSSILQNFRCWRAPPKQHNQRHISVWRQNNSYSGFYRVSYMLARYQLLSCVCPSVCPSARPFVTSRSCTKMAKLRITVTTPCDSAGTLVFRCQNSPWNSNRIIPTGTPNRGGVGSNRRFSTNISLYLRNGAR